MITYKKALASAAAACAVATVAPAFSAPASAHSDSNFYNYNSSESLEADVWLQTVSNWDACGAFQTKAYLHGTNPSNADWIRNTDRFNGIGVGVTVSVFTGSTKGNDVSFYWENTNAYESDLAGNVCGSYLTLYVEGYSTASAGVPKYGSPRTVTAHV